MLIGEVINRCGGAWTLVIGSENGPAQGKDNSASGSNRHVGKAGGEPAVENSERLEGAGETRSRGRPAGVMPRLHRRLLVASLRDRILTVYCVLLSRNSELEARSRLSRDYQSLTGSTARQGTNRKDDFSGAGNDLKTQFPQAGQASAKGEMIVSGILHPGTRHHLHLHSHYQTRNDYLPRAKSCVKTNTQVAPRLSIEFESQALAGLQPSAHVQEPGHPPHAEACVCGIRIIVSLATPRALPRFPAPLFPGTDGGANCTSQRDDAPSPLTIMPGSLCQRGIEFDPLMPRTMIIQ